MQIIINNLCLLRLDGQVGRIEIIKIDSLCQHNKCIVIQQMLRDISNTLYYYTSMTKYFGLYYITVL